MLSHLVDDADDHGPNRSLRMLENLARRVAFIEYQHRLTGTGADRVDSYRIAASGRLATLVQQLAEQQSAAGW